jgi:hypothetical protein
MLPVAALMVIPGGNPIAENALVPPVATIGVKAEIATPFFA